MPKLETKKLTRNVVRKLIQPRSLRQFLKLARQSKGFDRAKDDAQLKFYNALLPGDHLHYGYFDDLARSPEQTSLEDIDRAQQKYCEKLVACINDRTSPVIDVGCGMGGLMGSLLKHQLEVVGLTADHSQFEFLKKKYPQVTLLETKFEEMSVEDYRGFFGTVIMSESLQYLKLERALAVVDTILKNKGRWIVSDYFRTGASFEKSGHFLESFRKEISDAGWKIVSEENITPHVLPTLSYVYMWGQRAVLPFLDFIVGKTKRKHPAIYYLFEEFIEEIQKFSRDQLEIVNPQVFSRDKQYLICVLERA